LPPPVKTTKTTRYVQETSRPYSLILGKTVTELSLPVIQTAPQPHHIQHTNKDPRRQAYIPLTHIPQRQRPLPTQSSLSTLPLSPPLPCFRSATNSHHMHSQPELLTPYTPNYQNIEEPTNISPLHTQKPPKPTFRHLSLYTIPQHPLTIIEIYGGTTTGLEALLKTGHYIQTYIWADTNPYAHTAIQHRLTQLHHQYPAQLPFIAIN
jgi:hypothetical protein